MSTTYPHKNSTLYLCVFVRCGCRVPAGTVTDKEQGESHEGSESKTVQHEARGGD